MIQVIDFGYTNETYNGFDSFDYIKGQFLRSVSIYNPITDASVAKYTFDYYEGDATQHTDNFGYVGKIGLLKEITLPTGGTIDYEYEDRRYSFYYQTNGSNIYQRKTSDSTNFVYLAGTRVSQIKYDPKTTTDQIITRSFKYGQALRVDSNERSLRTNSDAHYPNNTGRLLGHIGHRWVEVTDGEGGFQKTYYTSGLSRYGVHSACTTQTDCPSSITEEEAFSFLGSNNPFNSGGSSSYRIFMPYTEAYGLPYKVETGYYTGSTPTVNYSSESKWYRVPSDQAYPQAGTSDVRNQTTSSFMYKLYDKTIKDGKETISYYAGHYSGDDCPGNCRPKFHAYYPLRSDPHFTITVDEDENQHIVENVYLGVRGVAHNKYVNMLNYKMGQLILKEDDPYYSLYATLICDVGLTHPSTCPSGQTQLPTYPGLDINFYGSSMHYDGGSMTYWDDSDGEIRPRETWIYEQGDISRTTNPCVSPYCSGTGSGANLPYSNNGRMVQSFDSYDVTGNLVETTDALGTTYSYARSDNGTVIGVFTNADVDDVFAHSFAYDSFGDWVQKDYSNDGDIEFSISQGKLKIKDLSGNNERDGIAYDLGTEISGSVVWEFDLEIEETDSDLDFQIQAGGSSWDFYSSNSASETAIWSAIHDEEWKVFNASASWVSLKTGLVVGNTYSFKIVMHTDNNTADYYLDGDKLMSGVSFRFGSSGIQKIKFGLNGNASINTEWFIDNVRIYPEAAQATTQEIDPNSSKPIAIKDVSGTTKRYAYDKINRLKYMLDNNEQVVAENAYSLSRQLTNDGQFDAALPNNVSSTSYSDGYYLKNLIGNWEFDGEYINTVDGFTYSTSQDLLAPDYLATEYGRVGQALDLRETASYEQFINAGDFDVLDTASEFTVSLWFYRDSNLNDPTINSIRNVLVAQSSDGSNDNFELGTYGTNIELYLDTGTGSQEDTKRTVNAGILDDQWYHIAFSYSSSNDQAKVYLNGELVNTWTEWAGPLESSSASPLTFGLARPGESEWGDFDGLIDEIKLFDVALTDEQVLSIFSSSTSTSYSDGLGRNIQSLLSGGLSSITTGSLFDSRGLQVATSRPISASGISGYVSNLFGTNFNPGSGLPSDSPIEDYYDPLVSTNSEDYAYSYTGYEQSMTSRVLNTTLPGYDHRSGTGNENFISYSSNTLPVSTPNKTWTSGKLYKTLNQNPENDQAITYADYLGRTVLSGIDMDNNGELSGSSDLITKFEYDNNSNVILVEDPRGLQTTYSYNAAGELLEKKLADQDHPNEYCYDDMGRLRFHANPNDFDAPYNYSGTDHYSYSYTKYDAFDRIVEIGEQDASFVSSNSQASFNIICANSVLVNDQNEPSANNSPTIIYDYDGINAFSGARNYQGRITQVKYQDPHSLNWGYTWYSYNELGLVEWIKQRLPGQSYYNDRTISYLYDNIGRMTKLSYDEGYSSAGDHYFWYYYDELGRLEKVTSYQTDSEALANTEAEYSYYADGQVEQLILGDGVQTMYYDYTVQGWLDLINDGTSGNNFSMILDYDLNGNINKQTWYQAGWYTSGLYPKYHYSYDNANRLTEACYGASSCSTMSAYDVKYGYDKSGNLDWIDRHGNTGSADRYLNHVYDSGTNRLNYVDVDGISGETQPVRKYFDHDAMGNVVKNEVQGITNATYDWRSLPLSVVTTSGTMQYGYDHQGNRIKKTLVGGNTTYYIRGVDGQTFAVYEGTSLKFLNILAGGQIIGQIIKN